MHVKSVETQILTGGVEVGKGVLAHVSSSSFDRVLKLGGLLPIALILLHGLPLVSAKIHYQIGDGGSIVDPYSRDVKKRDIQCFQNVDIL
ncbi:hypothetical protein TNCV_4544921 [Trichonephila clavipes]|nr:hypothetical protein TNCV_4544921 [Trichonephila clavipes]